MNTVTVLPAPSIGALIHQLLDAKRERDASLQAIRELEQQIIAAVGKLPEEGTHNADTDDYKVRIRCTMTRSVDSDALQRIAPDVPEEIGKRLFRYKPELVMAELRYLQNNEPALYQRVSQCITAKPAKPSIEIEPRLQQKAA